MVVQSQLGFPRVRGDVPVPVLISRVSMPFSPRARGCSALAQHGYHDFSVFPACAGMFRDLSTIERISPGFPRVRGDVPSRCFAGPSTTRVFPACAGMLPGRGLSAGY